jgi:hypothetical protein
MTFSINRLTSIQRELLEKKLWTRVEKTSTCWLWKGARNKRRGIAGSGVIGTGLLKPSGHQIPTLVHRLSYELTHGPIPRGLLVLHGCDIRNCVRPGHLHLGTATQNAAECNRRNRRPVGSQVKSSKLTEVDVAQIRGLHATNQRTITQLSRDYGMTYAAVRGIIRRKNWKHVE